MVLDKFIVKSKKGFTLIELLIVVAIIGILAAIAIPQFASYRIRAFNSAAQNDLRTSRTSLEGFYTDWYAYPDIATLETDGAIGNSTLTLTSTVAPDDLIVPLSSQVASHYTSDLNGQWFVIATAHMGGDRQYGTAQDVSFTYFGTKGKGLAPVWTDLPADSTASEDWTGDWTQL